MLPKITENLQFLLYFIRKILRVCFTYSNSRVDLIGITLPKININSYKYYIFKNLFKARRKQKKKSEQKLEEN